MQTTTHYSLLKADGTDTVNLLTQCYPNFDAIDAAMFANKQSSIGTATEVTTGTVHALTRSNTDSDTFRFTATSTWTAGDTMTLDGFGVTVHLADGTTPPTGSYIIGAEVIGVVNGSLVTLFLSSKIQTYVKTFNTRSDDVTPTAGDYDASMIDYDNASSGLSSTDAQTAIDEIASSVSDLDARVDANTFGSHTNLMNYSAASKFTAPSDGYISIYARASGSYTLIGVTDSNESIYTFVWASNTSNIYASLYVKKGMKLYTDTTTDTTGYARFYPIS